MNGKFDEEKLFARQNKKAERAMKIVVGVFVAAILYTLYVLVFDD